jgi:hypothetical protein
MTKIIDNLGMMPSVQERLRGVSQLLADQDNHVRQSSKGNIAASRIENHYL